MLPSQFIREHLQLYRDIRDKEEDIRVESLRKIEINPISDQFHWQLALN